MAQENLENARETQRRYYDKNTRLHKFRVGDKVLLLLPTNQNILLLNWKGPFVVTEVLNDCDYKIMLNNGQVRVFHANLLKLYEERCELMAVSVISDIYPGDEELLRVLEVKGTESTSDVCINPE